MAKKQLTFIDRYCAIPKHKHKTSTHIHTGIPKRNSDIPRCILDRCRFTHSNRHQGIQAFFTA